MTTRTWDSIFGTSVLGSILAIYCAYKTDSYQTVVAVGVTVIFLCLVVGGLWIYANGSEPLGEPDTDEPTPACDEVLAIADACACEHLDPLDTSVPAEIAFADRLALLDAEVEAVLSPRLKRELAHDKRWQR